MAEAASAEPRRGLEIVGVSKRYGKVEALAEVTIDVQPGEIVAVVGPSGAGKSTLLRTVAGLQPPSSGSVLLDGIDLAKVPAWRRNAALVQESYVLYPHLRVRENIAFPMASKQAPRRYPADEVTRRIENSAELLGIAHLLDRRVHELSGGQRQRVAIARALARDSEVLLLDEPLSHLDAKLRHWLRGELRRRLKAGGKPTLWATPDGFEAFAVADRVLVLRDGAPLQFATPREVFSRPATRGVAEISGSPPMNLLAASLDPVASAIVVDGTEMPLPYVPEPAQAVPAGEGPVRVELGVRPVELRIVAEAGPAILAASVLTCEFAGRSSIVTARLGEQLLRIVHDAEASFGVNETVLVDFSDSRACIFDDDGKGGNLRLVAQLGSSLLDSQHPIRTAV